jgi:hypothetical protein
MGYEESSVSTLQNMDMGDSIAKMRGESLLILFALLFDRIDLFQQIPPREDIVLVPHTAYILTSYSIFNLLQNTSGIHPIPDQVNGLRHKLCGLFGKCLGKKKAITKHRK